MVYDVHTARKGSSGSVNVLMTSFIGAIHLSISGIPVSGIVTSKGSEIFEC